MAPSMREVPLESNTEAVAFARTLGAGGFDMAIFLTGVGTRALARVVATVYPVEQFATGAIKIQWRSPVGQSRLPRIEGTGRGSDGNCAGTEHLARPSSCARSKIGDAAAERASRRAARIRCKSGD